MISDRTQSTLLFIAAIGMVLGLTGGDLMKWDNWYPLLAPSTWGQFFVHLSSVIAAFTGGTLAGQLKRQGPTT